MSLFSSTPRPASPMPTLIFVGPSLPSSSSTLSSLLGSSSSSDEIVSLLNPSTNTTQPLLTVHTSKSKPNVTISRILPNNNTAPLATASFSSTTGKATISLSTRIGQQLSIELQRDILSASGSRTFTCPQGTFHWKPKDSGTGHRLLDARKVEVARYLTCDESLSTKGYPRLEIVGQRSDEFVEIVLVTGAAVLKAEEKETKQAVKVMKFLTGDVGSLITGS